MRSCLSFLFLTGVVRWVISRSMGSVLVGGGRIGEFLSVDVFFRCRKSFVGVPIKEENLRCSASVYLRMWGLFLIWDVLAGLQVYVLSGRCYLDLIVMGAIGGMVIGGSVL